MAIRILHVGTGSRGRHWLEIVRDYPDAISVAFVDKEPKALDEATQTSRAHQRANFTPI